MQLYDDICPKTCENFKRLCEGVEKEGKIYQYKNTPIHRVVKNGWIQGGDIFGGNGNKGGSISFLILKFLFLLSFIVSDLHPYFIFLFLLFFSLLKCTKIK